MKRTYLPWILYFLCSFFIENISAQEFTVGELSLIKRDLIITGNYIPVLLSKAISDDPMINKFDINNPYTYAQMLRDTKGNSYHILIQTTFFGKILFLAYSNNLAGVINKTNKPAFMLLRCLKDINKPLSAIEVMNDAIRCLVGRLNYCAEN